MKIPPFYENPDGFSCMAACIRMGVEFFKPDIKPEFKDIDRLTGRREGEGTWPHGTYHALNDLGFEVEAYEPAMDYEAFIVDPEGYTKDAFADKPEFLAWLLGSHDLKAAAADAQELMVRNIEVKRDVPNVGMMKDYLKRGWLVIPNVDMYVLQNKEGGPEGHAVLIFAADNTNVRLHDPDAGADMLIPIQKLEDAWDYTGAMRREMLAFRPK
jgi:hypothetical protein